MFRGGKVFVGKVFDGKAYILFNGSWRLLDAVVGKAY